MAPGAGLWRSDSGESIEIIRARGKSDRWGRSEPGLAALIEALTEPGDLVAEPFTGDGVTGLACARIKPARRLTGADTDPQNVTHVKEQVRRKTGYYETAPNLIRGLKRPKRRVRSPLTWR